MKPTHPVFIFSIEALGPISCRNWNTFFKKNVPMTYLSLTILKPSNSAVFHTSRIPRPIGATIGFSQFTRYKSAKFRWDHNGKKLELSAFCVIFGFVCSITGASSGFGRGGAIIFFWDLEFCDMLGGFGGMLSRENF